MKNIYSRTITFCIIHCYKYIHRFGYIEECLNFPEYCSIWSSHTRIFMIYESFFTKNNVLSNICLVNIENNCFVSKRGLSQVKIESSSHLWHSSDIEFSNDFVNERDYQIDIPIYSVTSKLTTGTQVPNSFVCQNVPLIVCW